MCATCDFAFDHIHVCPACVANPTLPVSTRRIVQASLGLVLVGFATVVLGIIMAGLWELDERAAGGVFTGLILLPAVAGTVCACTAMSKRLGNNALLWTSTAWNLVMLGILGILMVVGMAKG